MILDNGVLSQESSSWDYPWPLQNAYTLSPDDIFDVTLVTYFE